MSDHLTLWIPGLRPNQQFVTEARNYLASLAKNNLPELISLNLILSRANRVAASDVIEHDFIINQLSDRSDQQGHWPLARWRLALEKMEHNQGNQWLCADPVYVHPDRSEALLFAYEELDIEIEEAQQLAELINQHYQEDPWELHVASSHRWYIKLNRSYDICTHVLHDVKGKNIFDYLPSGNDARYWQKCMNEMQMLLHGSEINQQREENNQLPINSLWLWGYGQSKNESIDDKPLHWKNIYSDNRVINGLGILSGSKVNMLPDEFDDIENIQGDVLVVIEQLQVAFQRQDILTWLDDLQYLEQYWFSQLLSRLKKSPGLKVTLLISKDEAYQFTAKQLRRWWCFRNNNKLFKA